MTSQVKYRIDPDRTVSWNIDKMIWRRFETQYPREIPVIAFTNAGMLWMYHQYVIWYDDLLKNHPVAQLCLPDK